MTLIAVKTPYEEVMAYFNNDAPEAMHYQEGLLNEYVKGGMAKLVISGLNNHEDCQYLVEGNKLAFRFEDKDYDLSIVTVFKNERNFEVTAISNSFELLFETYGEYSGKSMSFEQYFNVFKAESAVTIGINEVSEKRISNEWTGKQTLYARLFSLAEVFGAEIEFVTKLNDDYSLQSITANVYKEYADGVQGIGQNRTDLTFKYGKDVTTIGKTSDINDLYTAIKAYGKDGLSINDIEREWLDADGNVEYFTRKGQPRIYAPQARDRFPSTTFGSQSERYIGFDAESTEYSTAEALCGYMLSELKKNCVPKVTYDIEGNFDVNVGDTVIMEDDGYKPTLYLEVRAGETEKSLVNKRHRKMVVSNVKELASEIDASLLDRVQALIDANKTYQYSISTDNGIVFKNNTGTTTLTANVKNGVSDLTGEFNIVWYKDGVAVGTGVSITVQATEIVEKAVYRFEASRDGAVVGGYEVTVSDVTDGEEGFSPIVTPNDNGTITIVDKEGEKTTPDLTGPQGPPGEVDQELIDEITNAAEDAKKAGEEAQAAAEQAEADSALAVENANNAVNKANEASAKADQSQQTAEQAKSDATNAAGKAQSALDSAGQAVSSATDALNQAALAKSQAEEAINKYLGMGMVPAWSWSPDGADRFTTVYPRENALSNSRTMYIGSNNGSLFPISSEILVENGEQFVRVRRVNLELGTTDFSVFNTIPYSQLLKSISNKKVEFSCMARASKEIDMGMMAYMANPNKNFESHSKLEKITTEWTQISIMENMPKDLNDRTLFRFIPSQTQSSDMANFYVDYKNWKIAIVDDNGDKPTIYTPAPSEDYANAVPSYIGFAIEPSDNPADYTWIRNPEKVEGDVKVELTEINGELSRKVSQETFDQLNGTVTNHSTLISQNQNDIKLKADQSTVDTINQTVSDHSTAIDLNSKAIALKANQSTVDSLTGRVTTAEGSINTIAGQVALKANKTDVDMIAGRVSSAESQLTVQAGKITGLTSLTDGHTTKIGALELQAGQFSLSLSSVDQKVDSLNGNARNLFRGFPTNEKWRVTKNNGYYIDRKELKDTIPLKPNTEYVMSWDYQNISGSTADAISVGYGDGTGAFLRDLKTAQISEKVIFFKTLATLPYPYLAIRFSRSQTSTSSVYDYWDLAVREGNLRLSWSPAPEDQATVASLTEVKATVNSLTMTVADKADKTTVTQLANQWQQTTNLVNGHTSQISSLGDAINLRVIKNDIINQININDQGVLIAGQKVHITGQTTIDSAVIKTAHIADLAVTNAKIGSLSADKVTVGTLNGANVNIINLNASNIVSGEISGINIRAATFYGTSAEGTMQLNGTDLRFDTATNSFQLDYGGVTNINNAYGKRMIEFVPEGIAIRSAASNADYGSTNYVNSGIELYGKSSYIDFHNSPNDSSDWRARIVYNHDSKLNILWMRNEVGAVVIESAQAGFNIAGNITARTGGALQVKDVNGVQWMPVQASTFSQQSAYSLKTDFEPMDTATALKAITDTDIVKYHLIDELQRGNAEDYVSFIINDNGLSPYSVNPLLVNKDNSSFNTTTVVGVLMAAIKELEKQINQLREAA